ncbi:MAG: thiolase domain-containing protein [Dehalococcoidia bacterium]|jgi:acetyl-CoA C-acetyltransferase/acetyl-CoA acyltransferase
MRKVHVLGVGMTKFSGTQPKTALELFGQAATDAISESNLRAKDVQALFVGNFVGDFEEGQSHIQAFIADYLGIAGIPANRYENACASASAAIRDAFMWVASGYYDIVLAGGTETATKMSTPLANRAFAMASDSRYEYPSGLTFPGVFALLTHLYAAKYKIALEYLKQQLYQVSINSHYYGLRNPKAQFHKEITLEDAIKSPVVSTPLQLVDCCPFSDGAAALILASEEVARKFITKPVTIIGLGQASGGNLLSQKDSLPHLKVREISSKQAYKMAGIKPSDVDVVELHDCFSIATLIALESLGFCEYGTAGKAVLRGETKIDGRIPINLSGGLKAKGHPVGATGAAQVYEIVKQLRGECGERQAKKAQIGMTDTLGGDGGTMCNMILKKGW